MNFSSNKVRKVVAVTAAVWFLGGCGLLKQLKHGSAPVVTTEPRLCQTEADQEAFNDFCYAQHWLTYILDMQKIGWPSRIQLIQELGEEPAQLLQKILLSQGVDTPYQHRLRAQNWIIKLNTDAPDLMRKFVNDIVYDNSKQLLEFESAVTILSRINARQEKTIIELQLLIVERDQQIQKQQDQLEQLLKIETDLIEQNRNENR